MKLKIADEIFEKFSGLNIGVITAKNINNAGAEDEIQNFIRAQEKEIREKYNAETLSENPKISVWRKVYSSFGAKPKKNKCSVESLYRLTLQGNDLRHISKIVDLYNFISLKYMLPVGGEDIDQMTGDVVLAFAKENEVPVLLLGDKVPRAPHPGEVIYKDDVSTLCRRWNWREADRTKLTEETKNCIMVIEGLPPVSQNEVESATKELMELAQKFCGGEISYTILNENKREVEI